MCQRDNRLDGYGMKNGCRDVRFMDIFRNQVLNIGFAKNSEFLYNALGKNYVEDIINRKTVLAEEYESDKEQSNQSAFERI